MAYYVLRTVGAYKMVTQSPAVTYASYSGGLLGALLKLARRTVAVQ